MFEAAIHGFQLVVVGRVLHHPHFIKHDRCYVQVHFRLHVKLSVSVCVNMTVKSEFSR